MKREVLRYVVALILGIAALAKVEAQEYRYTPIEETVEALLAHKVDAVFYDRPAIVSVAAASGGRLAVTPLETRESYGIAVRKDRKDCLEAVNAVIRERGAK